jgi:hypothetical protein
VVVGSTDNTVCEGVGATVVLAAGAAEVVLNVSRSTPAGVHSQAPDSLTGTLT